jgi:dolichol-phosphate mannosyltransferase
VEINANMRSHLETTAPSAFEVSTASLGRIGPQTVPDTLNSRTSIVLPTYNEGHNVVPLITKIYHTMNGHVPATDTPEVVVIDDNSPDGTARICQSLLTKYPSLKIVVRTDARGLGSAVRRGISESSRDTVVVMDADFSHDCHVIPKLVNAVLSDSTDIAIASRYVSGGKMVAPLHLRAGSKALNLFIGTVLGMPVHDLTGGFFAAKRTNLQVLDSKGVFTGYGDYCFALLYEGYKKGLRLKEYPFEYYPRQDGFSKTGFFHAGLSYGLRALRLRVGLE